MLETAESIYEEYPRRVARKPAIDAIMKAMRKKPVAFLRDKVKEYATATKGNDKHYIPHPATWFNEERYNDDPEEWKRPTNRHQKTAADIDASTRSKGIEKTIQS